MLCYSVDSTFFSPQSHTHVWHWHRSGDRLVAPDEVSNSHRCHIHRLSRLGSICAAKVYEASSSLRIDDCHEMLQRFSSHILHAYGEEILREWLELHECNQLSPRTIAWSCTWCRWCLVAQRYDTDRRTCRNSFLHTEKEVQSSVLPSHLSPHQQYCYYLGDFEIWTKWVVKLTYRWKFKYLSTFSFSFHPHTWHSEPMWIMHAVTNNIVHIIMYFYYFLSSFNQLRKITSLVKPLITIVQIVQLTFFVGHCVYLIIGNCPTNFAIPQMLNVMILIYYFVRFYLETYKRHDKKTPTSKSSTKKKIWNFVQKNQTWKFMVILTGSNLEQKLKIQNAFDFIANNICLLFKE